MTGNTVICAWQRNAKALPRIIIDSVDIEEPNNPLRGEGVQKDGLMRMGSRIKIRLNY